MTVSRREVLIGTVATIAAANGPAFPTAMAAPVYVRLPLTPPAAIGFRYAGHNGEGRLLTILPHGRSLIPSPAREIATLLNMRRDLIAGGAVKETDLDHLDDERRSQLCVISWAYNWDLSDDGYAAHARAFCRWLDNAISN
jgi:hypothetical protein